MNPGRRVAAVIWMCLVCLACNREDLDPNADKNPDPFSLGKTPTYKRPVRDPHKAPPAPGEISLKGKKTKKPKKPKPKPKPINYDIPVGVWIVDTYLLADTFVKTSESVKSLPEEMRAKLLENMRLADYHFDFLDDGKWQSTKRYPHGMTELARGTWEQDKDVILLHQIKYNGKDVDRVFRASFDKKHIKWSDNGLRFRLYRKE